MEYQVHTGDNSTGDTSIVLRVKDRQGILLASFRLITGMVPQKCWYSGNVRLPGIEDVAGFLPIDA